jgi:hypothetical protein
MEIFTMKCPSCGRNAPPTMDLEDGDLLEIQEGHPAPSSVCICGTVMSIPPGKYKGTKNGVIKE